MCDNTQYQLTLIFDEKFFFHWWYRQYPIVTFTGYGAENYQRICFTNKDLLYKQNVFTALYVLYIKSYLFISSNTIMLNTQYIISCFPG